MSGGLRPQFCKLTDAVLHRVVDDALKNLGIVAFFNAMNECGRCVVGYLKGQRRITTAFEAVEDVRLKRSRAPRSIYSHVYSFVNFNDEYVTQPRLLFESSISTQRRLLRMTAALFLSRLSASQRS